MIGNELVKLTSDAIKTLVRSRELPEDDFTGHERRRSPRWPFPGTVEIREPGNDDDGPLFGTCRNLSLEGVGVTCDTRFDPGTILEIALHLPEASFCGKATVRYAREVDADESDSWYIGLQFNFQAT